MIVIIVIKSENFEYEHMQVYHIDNIGNSNGCTCITKSCNCSSLMVATITDAHIHSQHTCIHTRKLNLYQKNLNFGGIIIIGFSQIWSQLYFLFIVISAAGLNDAKPTMSFHDHCFLKACI